MNTKSFSIIGVIVVGLVLIGAAFLFSSNNKTTQNIVQPTPATGNKPLQIQTFYLDETGEPLTEGNIDDAFARNEERLNATLEQIDSDVLLVDQLDNAL